MDQEQESPKVKVSDRRRFSAEGEPLEETDTEPTQQAAEGSSTADEASAPEPPPPESAEADTTPSEGRGTPPLPPASFETLVLSLGMQAQFELGFGGQADQEPPNLDVARHSIDMLSVLQEKTKGNLSMEESRLLENTLTELRFRYVQVVGEINKQAKV